LRNNKAAASAVRTVTVLGATGSIGDSTMDLLRAARDRYEVEALTAHSNVQALAKLAREFGARFAAIADPDRLSELKAALAGTRTECGAGESAVTEAAARPADCGWSWPAARTRATPRLSERRSTWAVCGGRDGPSPGGRRGTGGPAGCSFRAFKTSASEGGGWVDR